MMSSSPALNDHTTRQQGGRFALKLVEYRERKATGDSQNSSLVCELWKIGIQEAKKQYLDSQVSERYLKLVQNYNTTSMLALVHNESFSVAISNHLELKTKRHQYIEEFVEIARKVITIFLSQKPATPRQIMELAELACFDNNDINTLIFNSLILGLESQLKSNSLLILDQHIVSGMTCAVRGFPSDFLDKNMVTLLNVVIGLANWANHKRDGDGDIEKTRTVWKSLSALLDAIADNSLMKSLACKQDENISTYIKHRIFGKIDFKEKSESMMKAGVSGGVTEVAKMTKGFFKGGAANVKKMTSLKAATTSSSKKQSNGVAQEEKDKLRVIIENNLNHEDVETRHCVKSCGQALARIVGDGEGTKGQMLFMKGLHLLAGAKSVAAIVLSQGLALNEYSVAIHHIQEAFATPLLHKDDWYPLARQLEGMVSGSKGNIDQYHLVVDAIESILKETKYQQEVHMAVMMVFGNMVSIQVEEENSESQVLFQIRIVGLVVTLYEDCGLVEVEQKSLYLYFLFQWAQSHHIRLSDMTKQCMKSLQQGDESFWRSSEGRAMLDNLKIPRNLDGIRPSASASHQQVSQKSDQLSTTLLLGEARVLAFPVEYQISQTRQKVESMRGKSGRDEEIKVFVPLKGARDKTASPEEGFDLENAVLSFVQNQSMQVLVMHGQAGSGKSLFGRCLEKRLWEDYEKGGTFPIVITLTSLVDPTHHAVEQTLSDYGWSPKQIELLKSEFGPKVSYQQLETMNKKNKLTSINSSVLDNDNVEKEVSLPRLVIILDGYDEIRTRENLYKSNRLSEWDAKVIVTARTEYLERMGDYMSSFSSGETDHLSMEVFIQSFTTLQIETYLSNIAREKRGVNGTGWTFEDYRLALNSIPGISDLIQHPFILQIVTEVLPALKTLQDNSVVDLEVTRALVYEMFTDHYFDRSVVKLNTSNLPEGMNLKESFLEMSMDVACFMYENETAAIKGPSPNYSRVEVSMDEGAKFFKEDLKTVYSRQGVPWKLTGVSVFAFMHKSISEYFIALAMYKDIMSAFEEGDPLNSQCALNSRLIQEEPSVARFLSDMIGKREKDRLALLSVVKLSRSSTWYHTIASKSKNEDGEENNLFHSMCLKDHRNDETKVRAAANAMTVLVVNHFSFSQYDLSGIRIQNAVLDSGNFFGTNFEDADLTGVSLRSAILTNVNFDNAILTNIELGVPISTGQIPSIANADAKFVNACFSSDRELCLTMNVFGSIEIWDWSSRNRVASALGLCTTQIYPAPNDIPLIGFVTDQLYFFNAKTKLLSAPFLLTATLNNVNWSSNGKYVVTEEKENEDFNGLNRLRIWDVNQINEMVIIDGVSKNSEIEKRYQFNHDCTLLITFHDIEEEDTEEDASKSLCVWDMTTGGAIKGPKINHVNSEKSQSFVFNDDSSMLAVYHNNGSVSLWNVNKKELNKKDQTISFDDDMMNKIKLTKFEFFGSVFVTEHQNENGIKSLRLWDINTQLMIGKEVENVNLMSIVHKSNHKLNNLNIMVSHHMNSQEKETGEGGSLQLWELSNHVLIKKGAVIKSISEQGSLLKYQMIGLNGLITKHIDDRICVWNITKTALEMKYEYQMSGDQFDWFHTLSTMVLFDEVAQCCHIYNLVNGDIEKIEQVNKINFFPKNNQENDDNDDHKKLEEFVLFTQHKTLKQIKIWNYFNGRLSQLSVIENVNSNENNGQLYLITDGESAITTCSDDKDGYVKLWNRRIGLTSHLDSRIDSLTNIQTTGSLLLKKYNGSNPIEFIDMELGTMLSTHGTISTKFEFLCYLPIEKVWYSEYQNSGYIITYSQSSGQQKENQEGTLTMSVCDSSSLLSTVHREFFGYKTFSDKFDNMVLTYSPDHVLQVWNCQHNFITPAGLPLTGIDNVVGITLNNNDNNNNNNDDDDDDNADTNHLDSFSYIQSDGSIHEWNVVKKEPLSVQRTGISDSSITFENIEFNKDLVLIVSKNALEILNVQKQQIITKIHKQDNTNYFLTKHGTTLVLEDNVVDNTQNRTKKLCFWDVENASLLNSIEGIVDIVARIKDDNIWVTSHCENDEMSLRIWDARTGLMIRSSIDQVLVDKNKKLLFNFYENFSILVTGHSSSSDDDSRTRYFVWDVKTCELLSNKTIFSTTTTIAADDEAKQVTSLWNDDGSLNMDIVSINHICFNSNAIFKTILIFSNNKLHMFDLKTGMMKGSPIYNVVVQQDRRRNELVQYQLYGKILVTSHKEDDGTANTIPNSLQIWNVNTGISLGAPISNVYALPRRSNLEYKLSRDGEFLLTAHEECPMDKEETITTKTTINKFKVCVWKVNNGLKKVIEVENVAKGGYGSVSFGISPDSTMVVTFHPITEMSADQGNVCIWDITTGELKAKAYHPLDKYDNNGAINFSNDSKTLLTGDKLKQVTTWSSYDMLTGHKKGEFDTTIGLLTKDGQVVEVPSKNYDSVRLMDRATCLLLGDQEVAYRRSFFGNSLVSFHGTEGEEATIRVYDIKTGLKKGRDIENIIFPTLTLIENDMIFMRHGLHLRFLTIYHDDEKDGFIQIGCDILNVSATHWTGSLLITRHKDLSLKCWDLNDMRLLWVLGVHGFDASGVVGTPLQNNDSNHKALIAHGALIELNDQKHKTKAIKQQQQPISSQASSPTNSTQVSAFTKDGEISQLTSFMQTMMLEMRTSFGALEDKIAAIDERGLEMQRSIKALRQGSDTRGATVASSETQPSNTKPPTKSITQRKPPSQWVAVAQSKSSQSSLKIDRYNVNKLKSKSASSSHLGTSLDSLK